MKITKRTVVAKPVPKKNALYGEGKTHLQKQILDATQKPVPTAHRKRSTARGR